MDTSMLAALRKRWPEDETKLHVYVVPEPAEVSPLIAAYQGSLGEFDFISPVPSKWIHATVMAIDDYPAAEVTASQRRELAKHLRDAVQEIPAFTVMVSEPVVKQCTVSVDLVPSGDFVELVRCTQEGAGRIFGTESVQFSNGNPHITLGYAKGCGDSGKVEQRLREIPHVQCSLTVSTIKLVDVRLDEECVQITWDEIVTIPLGS